MKRRCLPLRGDHNLLTPDTHTPLGFRPCEKVQSGGVASLSGASSDSKPPAGLTRQQLAASPTRRLRFEDETEKEVESRYLERQWQKRQVGQQGSGVLLSKPDLNLYINGKAGMGHVDKQLIGQTAVRGAGQCHTCERGLGGGINIWLDKVDKGWSLNRHHLNLRTEPIRETYIGSVTSWERNGVYTHERQQSVELNRAQVTLHQSIPTTGLPVNPYDPHSMGLSAVHPPKLHKEHRLRPEPKERRACEETKAESQALPTSEPMRPELHHDEISHPAHLSSRDDSTRLSLRRFFSTIRLSRTRTGSLDRLKSRTPPFFADSASSISRNPSSVLKKTSSAESLSVEVPLLQSKKSLLEPKKKKDCSTNYKPAADQFLPQSLSVEDVSCPSSVRSVGRILQVCPDGTFWLELHQPVGQPFGFIIRREKGQLNSGVYVEDIVNSTERLYAGLLAVGDEILEVNGEKVARLSLDQVTHLLIQNPSATIRVFRHQKICSQ
ncbi:uncharacterized protein KIAA1614-like isoform X2 [Archocentrus centrarchus]|uniref:uncharacterized protein KIAA1614-like isoform X2 n=1 Tax=Archocentrus centrarchus TaxID=63155 RepID=UPI0011E9CA93|nr:uncharacterized protein KIAA1614-like isoform X2 [Archocentrus centrarchus]